MRYVLMALVISFLFSPLQASIKDDITLRIQQNHTVQDSSYRYVREQLFGFLHLSEDNTVTDVYCNIEYTSNDGVGKMRIPDHNKINCEHTWPKSKFSRHKSYNAQLTDLHHLFPSNSRANSTRSNHPLGDVQGGNLRGCESSRYGNNRFEPADQHKGNVARAMFYFSLRYEKSIDSVQESYFRAWHKLDPVDEAEFLRNERIRNIQGNRNPFITSPDLVDKIEDF